MSSVGLFWAWQGAQAKAWPKVDGVIQSIEEKTYRSRGGIAPGLRIKYSYEYAGAVHEASQICFEMSNNKAIGKFEYLSHESGCGLGKSKGTRPIRLNSRNKFISYLFDGIWFTCELVRLDCAPS